METIQFVLSFIVFYFLIYKYLKLREKMKAIQALSRFRNNNFLLQGIAFIKEEDKQNHLKEYYEKEKTMIIDYLSKNELKSLSYPEIEKILKEVV